MTSCLTLVNKTRGCRLASSQTWWFLLVVASNNLRLSFSKSPAFKRFSIDTTETPESSPNSSSQITACVQSRVAHDPNIASGDAGSPLWGHGWCSIDEFCWTGGKSWTPLSLGVLMSPYLIPACMQAMWTHICRGWGDDTHHDTEDICWARLIPPVDWAKGINLGVWIQLLPRKTIASWNRGTWIWSASLEYTYRDLSVGVWVTFPCHRHWRTNQSASNEWRRGERLWNFLSDARCDEDS